MRGCAIVALVLLGLFVAALYFGSAGSGGTGGRSVEAEKPTISVTAADLWRAYDANEAAAQQQYGSADLEVSGTVAGVNLDFADRPVILLATPNQFLPAQAQLADDSKNKASAVSKGQSIVLRCTGVTEVIGTPMLEECSF